MPQVRSGGLLSLLACLSLLSIAWAGISRYNAVDVAYTYRQRIGLVTAQDSLFGEEDPYVRINGNSFLSVAHTISQLLSSKLLLHNKWIPLTEGASTSFYTIPIQKTTLVTSIRLVCMLTARSWWSKHRTNNFIGVAQRSWNRPANVNRLEIWSSREKHERRKWKIFIIGPCTSTKRRPPFWVRKIRYVYRAFCLVMMWLTILVRLAHRHNKERHLLLLGSQVKYLIIFVGWWGGGGGARGGGGERRDAKRNVNNATTDSFLLLYYTVVKRAGQGPSPWTAISYGKTLMGTSPLSSGLTIM